MKGAGGPQQQGGIGITSVYLSAYNTLQTAGWTYILYLAIINTKNNSLHAVYEGVSYYLRLCQGLFLLETVHAVLGLVKGSPAMAFMQWAGRSHVLFAIAQCIPQLWSTREAGLLVIVWAAIEVIRYPWYTLTLLNACPAALTWLRYTAFIPLYPVGVYAELALMYLGLPYMEIRQLHCVHLPNKINFGFHYPWFIKGLMAVYPLLWLQLYTFMFKQRAKKLATPKDKVQ